LEVTRRLKADKGTASIPIVALTAKAMRGDREHGLAAGCDGYLQKPISTAALLDVINRFTVEPQAQAKAAEVGAPSAER
jgi:two-component system cell cycle response regulator DivK